MPQLGPTASSADAVLEHVHDGHDLIVPTANGEPVTLLDAVEKAAAAEQIDRVRVHQVFALRDRPHHAAAYGDRLRHVSYFLGAGMRGHYEAGTVDLVPNDLGHIPSILRSLDDPLLVVTTSPPDEHGFVSLGTNANYAAALHGEMRVFAEVNARMPRTSGRNQIHLSDTLGWVEADYDLVAAPPTEIGDRDRTIAAFVAERIPERACLQIGIGSVPEAVAGLLVDRRGLGIHTELLSDGIRTLIESGAATGAAKAVGRHQAVTTDAVGTEALYEFLDDNRYVVFWPVEETNDPRTVGALDRFCAVNGTMQVDLLGQCASESLGTHYVSSTGGQADFMRGAAISDGGHSFIVTHSTAHDTATDTVVSRIVPTLTPGSVVSTHKNLVDKVVTEHGVAELRGRTVAQRASALIAVAEPSFRDDLERQARELGYLAG
ncbi:MAG: acetyl-CoA hydrolase/transferase C-terminal domain-containing protein [Actinomycetota bacterium]